MRKFLFCFLAAALAVLVGGRGLLPEHAEAAEVDTAEFGYNMLDIAPAAAEETAGSALIAEMNGYYFSRTPSAKNIYTGALAGKNLILICADAWQPALSEGSGGLYDLWCTGVRFSQVYLPEWYQGTDGREFALLSGLMPTSVKGETALSWAGQQDIYLPFALGLVLAGMGYDCRAYIRSQGRQAAYEALGFAQVEICSSSAKDIVTQTMGEYLYETPFFAFYVWDDADGGPALDCLLRTLEAAGRAGDTAVCLLTGDGEAGRGQLYLSGGALAGTAADKPCSELDITPTLLNLLGAEFDSRFLSGRDVFAGNDQRGTASDVTPLVSLYGSAYSDWVTDAGCRMNGDFHRQEECFPNRRTAAAYAGAVSDLVYERYIFARRIMENNYFALLD